METPDFFDVWRGQMIRGRFGSMYLHMYNVRITGCCEAGLKQDHEFQGLQKGQEWWVAIQNEVLRVHSGRSANEHILGL